MSAEVALMHDCVGCAAIVGHDSRQPPRAAAESGALTLLACLMSARATPQRIYRALCFRHRARVMDLCKELDQS